MSTNIHSREQQIVFLTTINKVLQEPMLDLEIRSRLIGQDLQLKRHLKGIGEQEFSKETAYDMLFIYAHVHKMRTNAVKDVASKSYIIFESYEDVKAMKERLNEFLPTINLPSLADQPGSGS